MAVIVHVDDTPDYQETFARIISSSGYSLRQYADSESAEVELSSQDLLVAVVDSIGFPFAERLRAKSSNAWIVTLSTTKPRDPSLADAIIPKSTPNVQQLILTLLSKYLASPKLRVRGTTDYFSNPAICEALMERVGVFARYPYENCSTLVASFSSLREAMGWIESNSGCGADYRVVQGPLRSPISLEDLELV